MHKFIYNQVMISTGRPMFGLQKLNRRYSQPINWRGGKISVESMNKTMSLKLKKINGINSARSNMEPYYNQYQQVYEEDGDEKQFFKTHSKVLKGKSVHIKQGISKNLLRVDSNPKQKVEDKVERNRPYFYSPNLEEKMNIYLNRLINRSEQQHINQLKEIQIKLQGEEPLRKPSYNTQNLFWRKMRKFITQRDKKHQTQERVQNINRSKR